MRKYWPLVRTLTYLIVGLFNTVFIRAEDIGSWKNYLGYFFLVMVVVEFIIYIKNKVRT